MKERGRLYSQNLPNTKTNINNYYLFTKNIILEDARDECAYYKASNRKFLNTGAVSASNKILDATASILVNKMMIKSSPKQNLSGCSGRCYF